jgi:hypothetical protein
MRSITIMSSGAWWDSSFMDQASRSGNRIRQRSCETERRDKEFRAQELNMGKGKCEWTEMSAKEVQEVREVQPVEY